MGRGRRGGSLEDLSEVSLCEEADLDGQILEHKPDGEGEEQDPHELVARVGPTLRQRERGERGAR